MGHKPWLAAATLLALVGLVAGQPASPFPGTWKGRNFGVDHVLTIAKEGDGWSLTGRYFRGGKEAGSFVGEDVKVADGVMTFRHKFVVAPEGMISPEDCSLKADRGGLAYAYRTGRRQRHNVALKRTTPVASRPAVKADEVRKYVGVWKGTGPGGVDERWAIAHEGGKWDVKVAYSKRGRDLGGAAVSDVELGAGGLTFVTLRDKRPEISYRDRRRCTLTVDGHSAELSFVSTVSSAKGRVALKREVVVAVKDKPLPKLDPDRLPGIWIGAYPPGAGYKVALKVTRDGDEWGVDGVFVGPGGKVVGELNKGKFEWTKLGLTIRPEWKRPPGVERGAHFVLVPTADGVRMEVHSRRQPEVGPLKRGDEQALAELRGLKKPVTVAKDGAIGAGGLIYGMGFLNEGKTLVVGMATGDIKFLDVEKRTFTRTIEGRLAMSGFGVSPRGDAFARSHAVILGEPGGVVEVFDAAGKVTRTLPKLPRGQEWVTFSPDGKWLLSRDRGSIGQSPMVYLRNVEDGKVLASVTRPPGEPASGLAFSRDGSRFCWAATADDPRAGRYRFIAVTASKTRATATLVGVHKNNINACAFSPDDSSLVSVDDSGVMVLWGLRARKAVKAVTPSVEKLPYPVESVAYSPDGKLVIAGEQRGYVFIRDAKTLAEVETTRPFRHNVRHLAFGPNGLVAIGTGGDALNGQIIIRKLPGGKKP